MIGAHNAVNGLASHLNCINCFNDGLEMLIVLLICWWRCSKFDAGHMIARPFFRLKPYFLQKSTLRLSCPCIQKCRSCYFLSRAPLWVLSEIILQPHMGRM